MNLTLLPTFFLLLFLSPLLYAQDSSDDLECNTITVTAPPLFVVPTGYTAKGDKDASPNQNYFIGNIQVVNNMPLGKRFVVPKRSIVQVSGSYKQIIEKTGDFDQSKNNVWVPVRVLSLPPENKKLSETNIKNAKSIVKAFPDKNTTIAEVGDIGFLKVNDLEKLDKQQDFTFVVKSDSELFKLLDEDLKNKDLKALEPLALRLKENDEGYEVNQCCKTSSNICLNYPIFEILNVYNKYGKGIEVYKQVNCEKCLLEVTSQIVPIEEAILSPIRSILSHPTLGLPEGSNNLKRISSIADLNFIDSRNFVQIPLTGSGDRKTGPFNSLHYSSESGNADVYMKPDVACGFMQFLKGWNNSCKGKSSCQIVFGDASHAHFKDCTKSYNALGKLVCSNPWIHESHTSGECIDISTSHMNDSDLVPMMKMLNKLGNSTCLSNENRLQKVGCKSHPGHNTHMHICFPSNSGAPESSLPNKALKQACESGVIP